MDNFYDILNSTLTLFLLAACAVWLRRRGIIRQDETAVFNRLITDFVLPILIFSSLIREPFAASKLVLPGIFLISVLVVMLVTLPIGKALRLERPVIGSLLLTAGFGSCATLGYSLVRNIYPNNVDAMNTAVVIGQLGAILPLFTVGVFIAIHFGRPGTADGGLGEQVKSGLLSPMTVSLVLGLLGSMINWPADNHVVIFFFAFFDSVGNSMPLLVAFTIGLMLRPVSLRETIVLITVVASLKLLLEPLLAAAVANLTTVSTQERQLLVLEAAVPSGALSAVLAQRYGCDGAVASTLVIIISLLSLITIPLALLLGG